MNYCCFAHVIHRSSYEEPSCDEGFEEIVKVNFIPKFKDDKVKELYMQFLYWQTARVGDQIEAAINNCELGRNLCASLDSGLSIAFLVNFRPQFFNLLTFYCVDKWY